MSEGKPMTFEGKTQKFEIGQPMIEDAATIGPMHLQSWHETYPHPDLDIDAAWIDDHFAFLADASGEKHRRDLFERVISGNKDIFYRVAKDAAGNVVGFCHAEKKPDKDENVIEGLYLLESAKGQGLGSELIQEALDWLDTERPVKATVVEYNDKAIAFYENYGFKTVPDRRIEVEGPIYAIDMIRSAG